MTKMKSEPRNLNYQQSITDSDLLRVEREVLVATDKPHTKSGHRMAQFDSRERLERVRVVYEQRVPLPAAIHLLPIRAEQGHRLAIRQRDLRVSLTRLVIDLPQVVPHEVGFVQIGW